MSIELIGCGLGRTGTSSLRDALNHLGYPCHHMSELAFNPDRRGDIEIWEELVQRLPNATDWATLFRGYRAVLDYPACFFWRELMTAYPAAKVVLTQHPGGLDAWYDSTRQTIYADSSSEQASAFGRSFNTMMDHIVWDGFFDGRFEERDEAIARHAAHLDEVRRSVPADRLIEFSPDEGWEPICAALGLAVPDKPFPRSNTRADMARRVARLERMKNFDMSGNGRRNGTTG